MNVLITGHSGFIGGHAAEFFNDKGHIVYGVSRSTKPNASYHQYNLDILNTEILSKIVKEKCIDTILHFAGKPLVEDCNLDPFNAIKTNGLGTASILEAGRYARVNKILIVETDKVYGEQTELPTNENAILNPNSPYEFSKFIANTMCNFYRKQYSMNIISIRPANVYGPGDYSFSRIVPSAMKHISENKAIPVFESATKTYRDFIYVGDVVRMCYILATRNALENTYNFSTNNSFNILDFATKITSILNFNQPPIVYENSIKFSEIKQQAIDGTRFLKEFDFVFTPFNQTIIDTYKAYCEKFNIPILGR